MTPIDIHTRLSVGLGLHLLDQELGDMPVVIAAVILHDAGFYYGMKLGKPGWPWN